MSRRLNPRLRAACVALSLPAILATRSSFADVPPPVQSPTANPPSEDETRRHEALRQFQSGRELMLAGRYAESCEAFQASEKLDAAAGTMLNLAYCYEKIAKTGSAWAVYRQAANAAQEQDRPEWHQAALARIARLEELRARVLIQVQSTAGDAPEVWLDDAPLPREGWGQPVPVDPGPHALRAASPRGQPFTLVFYVGSAYLATVTVPPLAPVPSGPAVEDSESASRETAPSQEQGVGRRTVAIVLGCAGLVAIGVGIGVGANAVTTYNHAACQNGACTRTGDDDVSRAFTERDIAIAALAAGGLAVGAAAVVWLSSPAVGVAQVRLGGVGQSGFGASFGGQFQ